MASISVSATSSTSIRWSASGFPAGGSYAMYWSGGGVDGSETGTLSSRGTCGGTISGLQPSTTYTVSVGSGVTSVSRSAKTPSLTPSQSGWKIYIGDANGNPQEYKAYIGDANGVPVLYEPRIGE